MINPQPTLEQTQKAQLVEIYIKSKLAEPSSKEQKKHYKRERVRLFVLD
jgi:hypothetical protein